VQLISLAKADRPATDGENPTLFDLVECTANTARIYAATVLASAMDISFESDCEELPVHGSAVFASEMITNLLDNAIRYGERGGHIVIRINSKTGQLEIEDDGPGIAVDELERVFERFYRSPRNLNREGSGLGLSIVQALGRRMGVTVNLTVPKSGIGLRVVIQFQVSKLKLAA
jgi:two-component system sensor histidine kinase TctE